MSTTQISGKQIKDGDITSDDIGDGACRGATDNGGTQREIATGTISDVDLRSSCVTGSKVLSTGEFTMGSLTITSTTHAFLPPRMTTTQRDAIGSPSAGMVVYNTDTDKLNLYTDAWKAISSNKIKTVTNTYLITILDETVICDRSTDFNITLPSATVVGQLFTVKNIGAGIVTVVADTTGTSDLIDGEATKVLTQWESRIFQCYAADKWGIM